MKTWHGASALRRGIFVLAVAAAVSCADVREDEGRAVLADPHAVELLVEQVELEAPPSDAQNRFHGGWVPDGAARPRGLRASPEGASFQVVTLTSGRRELALDLVDGDRRPRPVHVRARVDRGEPFLVPVADPLRVPLPAALARGRHLVELSPRSPEDPPLVVARARVWPAPRPGEAAVEGGELVQTGPSAVDVVARPLPGAVLAGELCRSSRLSPGRFAVELVAAGGEEIGRWEAGGGLLDGLRGCRGFELRPSTAAASAPGGPGPGTSSRSDPRVRGSSAAPVRLRFLALDPGAEGRWSKLSWRAPGAEEDADREGRVAESVPAGAGAPFASPRLVLVYVFDALRADHVGHLGGPEGVSPVLDRLAAEGFTFRGHRTNAPNTLPSIRTLFTGGIYLNQAAWRRVGKERPTLGEIFRDAGYRTGLFSGNGYLSHGYGLARGFDHVSSEALFQVAEGGSPTVNRNAERVHAAALDWLDAAPEGEPIFLYLQTIHPHNPYAPPERFERRFTAGIPSEIEGTTEVLKRIRNGELHPASADRERLRALYAASMAYNDAELGRFLKALAERVPPEETLALFTSDHGEELFDHGGVLHGYALWEELLRVPLVVWGPGRVGAGEAVEATDMLDLHATLAAIASPAADASPRRPGVDTEAAEAGGAAESNGRDLLPLLTGRAGAPPPGPLFAAAWGVPGGIVAIRDGPWKLIRVGGTPSAWWMGRGPGRTWQRHFLFDLAADPGEQRNLAGAGSGRDGVREQWLRARLRAWEAARWAEAAGEEAAAEEAPALGAEEKERLRALGYLD